jgi:membrane protease YdiL (CAAX protease family)
MCRYVQPCLRFEARFRSLPGVYEYWGPLLVGETKRSYRPLFVFLGLVVVLASSSYVLIFTAGNDDDRTGGFALLQFSPAISALVTKLVYQRNLRGLGWGWGKTRYQFAAVLLPLALGLVGFGLVWLTVGGFYDRAFIADIQSGIAESVGLDVTSPYIVMLILIFVSGTLGLLLPGFFAFGEELGWRGFLVPELYKHANFTRTALISGLIWSVYHYPLVIGIEADELGVNTAYLLISVTVGGIGISAIMAWLRLKSGSVWTAVLFHAALNSYNQGFFESLTETTSNLTNYLSGEFGLMMSLVAAFAGYLFWRKRDALPPPQT